MILSTSDNLYLYYKKTCSNRRIFLHKYSNENHYFGEEAVRKPKNSIPHIFDLRYTNNLVYVKIEYVCLVQATEVIRRY